MMLSMYTRDGCFLNGEGSPLLSSLSIGKALSQDAVEDVKDQTYEMVLKRSRQMMLLAETYGMLERCVDWFSCVARNVYSWGVLLTKVVEEPAGDTDVRLMLPERVIERECGGRSREKSRRSPQELVKLRFVGTAGRACFCPFLRPFPI